MPKFTVELPRKAVDRLQPHVQRSNDTNGTTLTLRQWIELHLKELAIADDLTTAYQQAQRDSQDTLHQTLRTTRDQLIQEL